MISKKIVSSYQSHSEQKLIITEKNEEENRNKKIFSIDEKQRINRNFAVKENFLSKKTIYCNQCKNIS